MEWETIFGPAVTVEVDRDSSFGQAENVATTASDGWSVKVEWSEPDDFTGGYVLVRQLDIRQDPEDEQTGYASLPRGLIGQMDGDSDTKPFYLLGDEEENDPRLTPDTGYSFVLLAYTRSGDTITFSGTATQIDARTLHPGDATGDGWVNFNDLLKLNQNYNKAGDWSKGDFTGDGTVNYDDLLILSQNYNSDARLPTPTVTATAISSTEVQVSWELPSGSPAVEGYEVWYATGGSGYQWAGAYDQETSNLVVGDLLPGTSYQFVVNSNRGNARSEYSPAATATTILPAPSDFVATQISTSQVNFTWTAGASTIDGYALWASLDGSDYAEFKRVPASQTGLGFHSPHYGDLQFRLTAWTQDAQSVPVDAIDAALGTPELYSLSSALMAPGGLATTGEAWIDDVRLSWEQQPYADFYLVEWSDDGLEWFVIDETTETTYADPYPTLGAQYYRVSGAISGDQVYISDPAAPLAVTPIAPPVTWADDNAGPNDRGTLSPYSTVHGQPLVIDVLGNDVDYDESGATAVVWVGQPVHGTAEIHTDGTILYSPPAGWYGTDTFTYIIDDGTAQSAAGTVSVDVTNAPPVAQSMDVYAEEFAGGPYRDPVVRLLSATDDDGDVLTFHIDQPPRYGTVTLDEQTGEFAYQPLDYDT